MREHDVSRVLVSVILLGGYLLNFQYDIFFPVLAIAAR